MMPPPRDSRSLYYMLRRGRSFSREKSRRLPHIGKSCNSRMAGSAKRVRVRPIPHATTPSASGRIAGGSKTRSPPPLQRRRADRGARRRFLAGRARADGGSGALRGAGEGGRDNVRPGPPDHRRLPRPGRAPDHRRPLGPGWVGRQFRAAREAGGRTETIPLTLVQRASVGSTEAPLREVTVVGDHRSDGRFLGRVQTTASIDHRDRK
jgi:hypothetical protein